MKKFKVIKAGLSALLMFAGLGNSATKVNAATQTIAVSSDDGWTIGMTDLSKIDLTDKSTVKVNEMEVAYSLTLEDEINYVAPVAVDDIAVNNFSEYTQAEATEANLRKAVNRNKTISTFLPGEDVTLKDKLERALMFGYPQDKNKIFGEGLTDDDKYTITQSVILSITGNYDETGEIELFNLEEIFKDESSKLALAKDAFTKLRALVLGNEDASSVKFSIFNPVEKDGWDLISMYIPSGAEKPAEEGGGTPAPTPDVTPEPTASPEVTPEPTAEPETPIDPPPTEEPTVAPAENEYKIVFDANGGEGSTEVTIEKGKALESVPEATREGYKFEGWFTEQADGEKVDGSLVPESDLTLYAHWSAVNPAEDTPSEEPTNTPEEPGEEVSSTPVLMSVVDFADVSHVSDVPVKLVDSEGNEIETWKTADTAHSSDLKPGQYALKIESPAGYLSVEDVTFEVDNEGNITSENVVSGVIFVELHKIINLAPTMLANDKTTLSLDDASTPAIFKISQSIVEGSKTLSFNQEIPNEFKIKNVEVGLEGLPEETEFDPEIKIEGNVVSFTIEKLNEIGAKEINVKIETEIAKTDASFETINYATITIDGTSAETERVGINFTKVEKKVPAENDTAQDNNSTSGSESETKDSNAENKTTDSNETKASAVSNSGTNSTQQNTSTQNTQNAQNNANTANVSKAPPNTGDHGLAAMYIAFFAAVLLGGCAFILRQEYNYSK